MTYGPVNSLEPPLNENLNVPDSFENTPEFNTKTFRQHARKINVKDSGFYVDEEIINDQRFFNTVNRQIFHTIFRKVVDCGALPNTALKQVPHNIAGIGNGWMFTRIYGTAREPAGAAPRPFFIPLPNSGNYQVELMVDTTNINITTVANLSAFTQTYVILEFWKV